MECGECGKLLAIGVLASQHAKQHGIYHFFVLEEDWEGGRHLQDNETEHFIRWRVAMYRYPVLGFPQGQRLHLSYHCEALVVGLLVIGKCAVSAVCCLGSRAVAVIIPW